MTRARTSAAMPGRKAAGAAQPTSRLGAPVARRSQAAEDRARRLRAKP